MNLECEDILILRIEYSLLYEAVRGERSYFNVDTQTHGHRHTYT